MNLLQIATAIGQKLGVNCTDPNSRDGAAVRNFVQLRHDQLWRSFLWKDSICLFSTTIDTTVADYVPTANYMPTKGNLILPPVIAKVLAARTTDNKLDVERPMVYFRVNPDEFQLSGTPLGFYLLSGACWELDTPQPLLLVSPNAADNATMVTLDELQANGVTLTRSAVGSSPAGAAAGTTDRLDNVIKPATAGIVQLTVNTPLNLAGITYAGAPIPTAVVPVTAGQTYIITPGANENGMVLVNGAQTLVLATNVPVTVTAQGAVLNFQYPSLTPGNAVYVGHDSFLGFLANLTNYYIVWGVNELSLNNLVIGVINSPGVGLSTAFETPNNTGLAFLQSGLAVGPVTAGFYNVAAGVALTAAIINITPFLTLQAADIAAPKCQRIRLMPTPQVATTVRVLGKMVTPAFSAETDSPGVPGMDGILFALGYYDFKSRDEGGGTPDAAAALTEAVGPRFLATGQPGGFLQHLIEEEVYQAAHESRIMPECGFGDPTYYGANETSTKFWS